MDVYIYNNNDDNRVLNKTLYVQRNVIADIKGTCSITSPTLILSYQGVDFNYIYVPAWSRYYFVTDITVTTGGRVEVRCKVDVLMSYRGGILNTSAHIIRSETKPQMTISDDHNLFYGKKQNIIKTFGSGFTCDALSKCFLIGVK